MIKNKIMREKKKRKKYATGGWISSLPTKEKARRGEVERVESIKVEQRKVTLLRVVARKYQ